MSLPDRALSNFDIEKVVKELGIRSFRGVFMKDTLPRKPLKDECLVLNLDSSKGRGNHWLCIVKRGKAKVFFDSYGLTPPPEVTTYLGKDIHYNTTQVQEDGWLCGHYSLCVLAATNNSTEKSLLKDTQEIINQLFYLLLLNFIF